MHVICTLFSNYTPYVPEHKSTELHTQTACCCQTSRCVGGGNVCLPSSELKGYWLSSFTLVSVLPNLIRLPLSLSFLTLLCKWEKRIFKYVKKQNILIIFFLSQIKLSRFWFRIAKNNGHLFKSFLKNCVTLNNTTMLNANNICSQLNISKL